MVYNPNPGGLNIQSGNDNQIEAPGFVGGQAGATLAQAAKAPNVAPVPGPSLTAPAAPAPAPAPTPAPAPAPTLSTPAPAPAPVAPVQPSPWSLFLDQLNEGQQTTGTITAGGIVQQNQNQPALGNNGGIGGGVGVGANPITGNGTTSIPYGTNTNNGATGGGVGVGANPITGNGTNNNTGSWNNLGGQLPQAAATQPQRSTTQLGNTNVDFFGPVQTGGLNAIFQPG